MAKKDLATSAFVPVTVLKHFPLFFFFFVGGMLIQLGSLRIRLTIEGDGEEGLECYNCELLSL